MGNFVGPWGAMRLALRLGGVASIRRTSAFPNADHERRQPGYDDAADDRPATYPVVLPPVGRGPGAPRHER